MNEYVTILRGLPGSGKSTFVKTNFANCFICSTDNYFTDNEGNYKFDPAKLTEYLGNCLREYNHALRHSKWDIVVDNTNISAWEIAPYYSLAVAYSWNVEIVTLHVPLEISYNRNIYKVPSHILYAMYQRLLREELPTFWKHRVIYNV